MSDQVLVIGAGIAGIQTSLDLAAAGARDDAETTKVVGIAIIGFKDP